MCLRIAKVDEKTISQELSGVTFIACDDLRTDRLVCSYDIPIVFWIKEAGELGRLHQITEHHRELPSFRFWCTCFAGRKHTRGWLMGLCQRWLCRLVRWRGWSHCLFDMTSPDEPPPFIISYWMHVEDFILQIVEVVVIKVKASLEGTIGYPSLAFQQFNNLRQHLIKGHSRPFHCLDCRGDTA